MITLSKEFYSLFFGVILKIIFYSNRSLKCKICTRNFEITSKIHPICDKPANDDYLAHMECMKCQVCKIGLQENDQFYFDLNENLLCKTCTIENYNSSSGCSNSYGARLKKKVKSSDRLSSKQKEMIKKKVLLVENFDDLNLDLDDLATQIDCSLKALLKYVDKQFNKKSNKLINIDEKKRDEIFYDDSLILGVDNMMEQLKKMDKTIAPNKNPFSYD